MGGLGFAHPPQPAAGAGCERSLGASGPSYHPGVETGRMEKGHRRGTAADQPWGQGETHPGEPLPHLVLKCPHLAQLWSRGRPGGPPHQQQPLGTRTVGATSPSATARGHVQLMVATRVSWSPARVPSRAAPT